MKMAYGTLGWHVEYLQPAIMSVSELDALAFYYGHIEKEKEKKKTLETKKKIEDICKQLGIQAIPRKLQDIFDFVGIVKQIKMDIKEDLSEDNIIALFNIAGGTKPMCAAALMVCIFKGIPTQYVNEETGAIIPLPLLEADYLAGLTKREREIAQYLVEHKKKNLTQADLAKQLGKKRGTLNPQIGNLVKKGIVVLKPSGDGRSKIIKLTEGMELLLE